MKNSRYLFDRIYLKQSKILCDVDIASGIESSKYSLFSLKSAIKKSQNENILLIQLTYCYRT